MSDYLEALAGLDKEVLIILPVTIASLVLFLLRWQYGKRVFVHHQTLPAGELSEAQKQSLAMVKEMNKFLVSIPTLMFGGTGFYLASFDNHISNVSIKCAFLLSFILLGLAYVFAFRAYGKVMTELSYNVLAMKPGKSKTVYFLEMEFWASASASAILFSILVAVVLTK